ncbi:uncharacterized protein B0J16DRAFT_340302 [Fusarium flagelliforme]|uniref:uncharacterized protein n=1 Tax=Fusarium flagelliforme TaxID=2675880 RepID=UPI001E8DA77F|nr:uncharacterized protein B0J16DRAFT_340302 [Fusarium flagelliforme]KAH7184666.1 hypothetical protein B0J16DRAFT_340302 [Fusarium flagelliforme]
MPNRFKTPNYPTLASDATAPPTVRPGDFGGVQAEDMVKKRDLPNRFKTPKYPTLPLDGTPPTVRSGDFGGVQAPYHIDIPSNSTTASEAVATPTPQPESFEQSGLIAVLKEKYGIGHGIGHTKREDGSGCLLGFPIFGRCIPSSKHPQAPSLIEALRDWGGTKRTKREAKKEKEKEKKKEEKK